MPPRCITEFDIAALKLLLHFQGWSTRGSLSLQTAPTLFPLANNSSATMQLAIKFLENAVGPNLPQIPSPADQRSQRFRVPTRRKTHTHFRRKTHACPKARTIDQEWTPRSGSEFDGLGQSDRVFQALYARSGYGYNNNKNAISAGAVKNSALMISQITMYVKKSAIFKQIVSILDIRFKSKWYMCKNVSHYRVMDITRRSKSFVRIK